MKRKLSLVVILLFLLATAATLLTDSPRAGAQQPQPPAAPPAATTPPASTVNEPPVRVSLDCAGCHGPGKSLPYLAGDRFHKDAHAAYDTGWHARAAQSGRKAAACVDCHSADGTLVSMLPKSDPRSTINRANVAATCGKCHGDEKIMGQSGIGNRLLTAFNSSVHADAMANGNLNAATCVDCHNSHDIRPGNDPRSPINKFNIPQTCGACHGNITTEFNQSVHGTSIGRGNSQSPSCTDCHGIHNINSLEKAKASLRTNSCAKCHEGVRLTQEFGVAVGRVSSFEESYHGLAKRLGSDVVADCSSCHGVHNILPSSDPRSMIAPANRQQTCGQCHPGAAERFVSGIVHLNAPLSRDPGSVGVRWVRWFYLGIIFATVGGMLVHNGLAWRKKAAQRLRHERRTVVRLTFNQRVQHWLLLTSFITLVVTGFALVYPDFFAGLGMAEWSRRIIHRVAGVVMMIVSVYHVLYLALTREGRSWIKDMLPTRKDVRDVIQFFRHYLGGNVPRPKFERFGYAEKFEYWALVWGTMVMALTGVLIWFKTSAFAFAPLWWVDIAIAIHFYEAVLATLAIIVWHFYQVIFDPDVYPINLAFYDGRMSEEFYRHEHELDYERMKEAERAAEESEPAPPERREPERQADDQPGPKLGGGPAPTPSQGD